MTQAIFEELLEEIFNPLVFDYIIDGETYTAYSQPVPPTAINREDIQFFIMLLVNKKET